MSGLLLWSVLIKGGVMVLGNAKAVTVDSSSLLLTKLGVMVLGR